MNAEEYRVQQAAITAGLALYVQRFAKLFTGPSLSLVDWLQLLQVLFPEVQRRYKESATLGRFFYDSQREIHFPNLERNERLLSEVQFDWFVKNMEPARKAMSQADSSNAAVSRLALAAVREVEMAGRRQIIGAVKDDPVLDSVLEDRPEPEERAGPDPLLQDLISKLKDPKPDPVREAEPEYPTVIGYDGKPVRRSYSSVKGWARVATGAETCAWCLMLISRGPTYLGANTAGLRLDDTTVADLFREAGGDLEKFHEETEEYMEEWHAGCDCLVVPVFDAKEWPGKAAKERAEQLWIEASKEAKRLREAEPGRTYKSGENKGEPITFNDDVINALRRRIYRGEIDMSNYAVAA